MPAVMVMVCLLFYFLFIFSLIVQTTNSHSVWEQAGDDPKSASPYRFGPPELAAIHGLFLLWYVTSSSFWCICCPFPPFENQLQIVSRATVDRNRVAELCSHGCSLFFRWAFKVYNIICRDPFEVVLFSGKRDKHLWVRFLIFGNLNEPVYTQTIPSSCDNMSSVC